MQGQLQGQGLLGQGLQGQGLQGQGLQGTRSARTRLMELQVCMPKPTQVGVKNQVEVHVRCHVRQAKAMLSKVKDK